MTARDQGNTPVGTIVVLDGFLVVGIVSTGMVTALCKRESRLLRGSLHILEAAIQLYRAVRGETQAMSPYIEFPMLTAAKWCAASILALFPAWAAAVLASRWMRRRCRRKSEMLP